MAAAYAALVSFMNVLNQVQQPSCPVMSDKRQMQTLFDEVSELVDLFEACSQCISKDSERKITDAAYAAQGKLESYVVFKVYVRRASKIADRIRVRFARMHYSSLHRDLKKSIKGINRIIHEAMEVKQKKGEKNQQPRSTVNVGSSVLPPSGNNKTVGFEEEVNQLLEQLVTGKSSREIVPVVGMGGIVKSTLAVSVYNHPYVRDTFDVKVWVDISQVHDIGSIIRQLLHNFSMYEVGDDQLGDQLHRYLFGRKYLIVLDDIWDSKAWDDISRFLPDNNNGSRILLTTRILNVALSVGSCNPYEMKLLDDDNSWDLFSEIVFGHKVCPPELENCGKKIAWSCKGLPLAIVVIGGILEMCDKTPDY